MKGENIPLGDQCKKNNELHGLLKNKQKRFTNEVMTVISGLMIESENNRDGALTEFTMY